MNISIHALREEGDEDALDFLFEVLGFLSTPSARRATVPADRERVRPVFDFYPRPPRGGRPVVGVPSVLTRQFLSTPSARRATRSAACLKFHCMISIHALREEGDWI